MKIVALRSDGWISRIIAWFRPPYNHIELWFDDCRFSADSNGVVKKPLPSVKPVGRGVVADVFVYKELSPAEEAAAREAAEKLIGTDYDFWELFFGYTRKGPSPKASSTKLICGGLVLKVSQEIGRPLLERVREDRASPRDLTRSPLLRWVGSSVVKDT
jgi:hypothetical protein